MSTHDLAAEALNDGIRIPKYDGSNPMEVLVAESQAHDRHVNVIKYPPKRVTEPAAVSVNTVITTFGGTVNVHDNRTKED